MSWTKLKRGEHNRVVRTVNVRITATGYPRPRMIMRVARSLAAAAGFPVTEASRVHVLVGSDEDAGWVKIETSPEGDWFCECRGKNEALKIVAPTPLGAPDALDTTKCEGETGDGSVKFRMPWLEHSEHYKKTWTDEVVEATAPPKDWCAEREVKPKYSDAEAEEILEEIKIVAPRPPSAPKPKPPAEKPKKPAAAPSPKPPAAPAMRTFKHGSESVALSDKHHAIATKLYAARKKGFLVYADLMTEAKTNDVETIRMMVSTLRKQLDPLGLAIQEIQKMGYQMKESLEPMGASNGAEA